MCLFGHQSSKVLASGCIKDAGVTFNKKSNKVGKHKISINGTQQLIGHYNNEEDEAVDYACSVFKLKVK